MDLAVLLLFAALLVGCILCRLSILWALGAGYVLFFLYALRKGFSAREILKMSLRGILTVRNVLITFLFIGSLTALWRASGCIPAIVCYASGMIRPSVFLVLTFLLCTLVSVLTGTSFGTSATMGVICMSIAGSMGLPVFWVGGAVLSGAFFGDRWSPVSTSALLVSTITGTELYDNLRRMIRTTILPTLIVCAVYLCVGFMLPSGGASLDVRNLFRSEFLIRWYCLLPALVIFALAFCRVDVKRAMFCSILTAAGITLWFQGMSLPLLFRTMLTGFHSGSPELASVIDGGGILSMVRVAAIVCIASCYSGIFRATGLLNFLQDRIRRLSGHIGAFPATVLVSVPAAAIACNQTLAIMLTQQLVAPLAPKEDTALHLENSVVLISALIPWSIAGTVPLAAIGAPVSCMLSACFLYVVPLWNALVCLIRRSGRPTEDSR